MRLFQLLLRVFQTLCRGYRISSTEALLLLKKWVYIHLKLQYQYHTEAAIEYIENYVEEFPYNKDVFSRLSASTSSKKVLEAFKTQISLDNQEEWESDPIWSNLSAAVKHCHVENDKMQIESNDIQHLVGGSDINLVKMHLVNHFSDHIYQLSNLLNIRFELPEREMMDL